MKLAILLANGFEESEALITYDLLHRSGIKTDLLNTTNNDLIETSHGVKIIVNQYLSNHTYEDYDGLILPGGIPGVPNLKNNQLVIDNILKTYENKKYLFAICAAPSILSDLNLLNNLDYTAYPGFEGKSGHYTGNGVEVNDYIITAKGMGQTTNFGLSIIEKLISKEKALEIKNGIFYD